MIEEIKTFKARKEELIKKGKEKGFITYEELANGLKGLEVDSDSLDELYNSLMENNIEIVTDESEVGGTDEASGGDIDDILKDNTIAKEISINEISNNISEFSRLYVEENFKDIILQCCNNETNLENLIDEMKVKLNFKEEL